MQHISPSWHCGRNTRRGPSNRLKTNLLCLAALFLFALAPRAGWAQRETRDVSTPQQFSEALALSGEVTINIKADFILNNGHTATKPNADPIDYNSVYLVAAGKKTINGQKSNGGNYKITRGSYENNSIVLDNGAWLVIENLILDGDNQPNYASMVVAPPAIKKKINNVDNEYDVNAKLEMRNCTIQNCKQTIVTQGTLDDFTVQQTSALNGYNYTFAASGNSGGAGVHFAPGKAMNGNIDNKITIENCYFLNNQITEGANTTLENGGALALAGEFARGGTIEGCKFQQNYARNYGGAIWFAPSLKTSNGSFQFLGTTLVGGSVAMKNWSEECGGGIAVEGGYLIFDGQMYIRYNTTGMEGGGIYAEGGKLEFTSSGPGDFIDISYNEAADRGGGGICMKSYVLDPLVTTNLEVIAHDNCTMDISNNTAGYGGGICVGNNPAVDENQKPYWSALIEFNSGSNDATSVSGRINIYQNKALQPGAVDGEGGGGIFVREKFNVSGVKTTFTNCIVHHNIAKANTLTSGRPARGGGVAVVHSTALFEGCHIYNNGTVKYEGATGTEASDDSGGGVSVTETYTNPTFRNCHIYNNGTYNNGTTGLAFTIGNTHGTTLTSKGGGVFVGKNTPAVSFIGCHIYNNEAIRGGGLYMAAEGAKLKDACHVYGNRAHEEDPPRPDLWKHEKGGGGIFYENGKFEGINYVYDNTTDSLGGGMFVYKPSNAEIQGLVIGSNISQATNNLGNKAQRGGGIYAYSSDYAADNTNYSLTINNCKIVYNQKDKNNTPIITGGGLWMGGKKFITVKLAGGTLIDHNKADNGGGVYVHNIDGVSKHTLELINTTLSNNIATEYGGGIFNEEQIVTSANNDGTITFHGNRAVEGNGGGIHNGRITDNENGQVLLTGTNPHIFTENRARSGGGIHNKKNSTCSLKNCQIGQSGKGNEAATAGGGIFVESGATTTLLPGNITFEDNRASGTDTGNGNGNQGGSGGGIYNLGTVTQRNTCKLVFDHNIANQDGGGIYHEGDLLTLTNAIFKNNTATENGGGIYTAKTCILNNCTMGKDSEPNHAKNGGGIYKKKDELTIQGGSVSHNTASINGGGIYLEQENTLVYDSCLIQKNVATNNGGGIYVQGANEAAGLAGTKYYISAITVLNLNTNETVGLIKRLSESVWLNTLCGPGGLVSNVEITANGSTLYNGTTYFEYPLNNNYGQPPYTEPITVDQNTTEIRNYVISLKLDGNEENHMWDDGNHKVIARFEYPNDDYFEVEGIVSYDYYYSDDPELSYLNANEYYYEVTSVPIAGIVRTATLTLNGSTVGGAGKGNEASKGNEAGTGDGGGIYIEKYAKVIMTSDGSSTAYSNGIRNDVTHNKAKQKAGGVYKDGTLQVEGHVIITENEAEHSTGSGSKAGEVPENVYIPTESDDDQTILITGELACGSSIGVTKTKMWDNVNDIPYGDQGEHTYQDDDHLEQVRTAIAKVSPSSPTQTWAENAFHKRIFFDDKGYYRVWSFNYSNSTNTDNAYSDQNDYFIETWRSFANATGFSNNTVSTNAGFAYFAKQVNDGETVSAASQNATIDLAGHYWEPIGYTFCGDCNNEPDVPFAGTYNGNGHFILNAISILPEKEMGLFGNVTGTVKHTFAVGNLFANTHDHASNNHGSAGLGAIVGKTTGTIDGCEAAGFTLKGYATSPATVAAGGIAGNVGASGEVRNSFTSGITFTGTITNAGGLVGNIASGGAVKNCYSKAAIPASGTTKGALVGNNAGTLSNAYTSATTGAIVGYGTQGTNIYAAGPNVFKVGSTGDKVPNYTAPIGADHLGYMCIDNGVAITNTNGLTEGKDYFKFKNASGSEVNLIPLFRLLNLNNSDNYTTYAEWARPALAYYNSSFNGIERPINGDLPLLMLNNYDGSTHIGQGGFRSVGTYGGGGDVLQYGGPDRDGNELDAALTRPKVTGFTGNDYLFVYGDVNVAPAAELNAFTQAKVSIYEHAAISRAGTLAGFNQTYVGVTFDNSGKVSGSATNGINYIDNGPSLPRNWHMLSTPVSNAPLGFYYPGEQNSDKYTSGNYSNANFFNNPWGDEDGNNNPNSPSANEFSWLNGGNAGHNRYWMYGWNNSRVAGTHDNSTYPVNTWVDGYFPSKVNTSAIQFGAQLFIQANGSNGSNEYTQDGDHRYPYGMDFYSWYEPKYHYINFKRNGPNHWHSNAPHVHLDYTPEEASNNSGATAFGQNVNETTLLDGKGYMASIHIPTFLQTSGSLGGSEVPEPTPSGPTVYRVGIVNDGEPFEMQIKGRQSSYNNTKFRPNSITIENYHENEIFAHLDVQQGNTIPYYDISYIHNLTVNGNDVSGLWYVAPDINESQIYDWSFDSEYGIDDFLVEYAKDDYIVEQDEHLSRNTHQSVASNSTDVLYFVQELLNQDMTPTCWQSEDVKYTYSNGSKVINFYQLFKDEELATPYTGTYFDDDSNSSIAGELYMGVFYGYESYYPYGGDGYPLQLFLVTNETSSSKSPQEIQNTRQKAKTIKVTYNENDLDLCEGWNLVGNPFHSYMDFNKFCKDNTSVNNTYIVYNADGFQKENEDEFTYGNGFSYYVAGSSQHGAYASQYLHPHQGFFVKVSSSTTLNFAESQTVLRSQIGTSGSYRDDSRPAYPLVNLFLTSDKGCSDVCVVEFNRPEWGGATKLRDMYSGNGLFYAAHDNGNYAALFATPEAERIPLKFEAKDEAGDTYTIHWNTQNGDFHKLYLVDNITGVQYDMLRNSSYSFSGKKDDYWTRFYITFEVTGLDEEQDDEDDDASTGSASTTFAFFDGSQWVVTNDGHGTATLDLIDLQGRVLHSTTLAEGQARIGLPDVAKGMYLMRMTNQNGMFVQKIVVR